MQVLNYLELRMRNFSQGEDAFMLLAARLHAKGTAIETDADTMVDTHVMWFACEDALAQERLQADLSVQLQDAGIPTANCQWNLLGEDWATAWQKHWTGVPVGRRLWVRPSFCDAPNAALVDIVLDPGMAFGTGTHPTTRLCLQAIERLCDAPEDKPETLLDMGAGSGLLAIAAGKLGVNNLLAIDNDAVAVDACMVNAKINGVHLKAVCDDVAPARQVFDCVVANILATPLISLAPGLAKATGARLILSGLLETQLPQVEAAYVACGMQKVRSDVDGEWASLEMAYA